MPIWKNIYESLLLLEYCFYKAEAIFWSFFRRQPGFFQRRVVFLELAHFDKHSPIARERKTPQAKNLRVFCLETLKSFILNDKFYLKMTTVRAFFPPNQSTFFHCSKKGRGDTPPRVTRLVFNFSYSDMVLSSLRTSQPFFSIVLSYQLAIFLDSIILQLTA